MQVTRNGSNIYVPCELEYAKVRADDRDMGPGDGSDLDNKIKAVEGSYCANLVVSEAVKEQMLSMGLPHKGLHSNNLVDRSEGGGEGWHFKARRGHLNPNFKNKETGDLGIVVGPPRVIYEGDDGELQEWDFSEMGLLGNGTRAKVKLNIWSKHGKSKVTLEAINVIEHVPYEDGYGEEGF
jgi:hypothetical protein